MSNGEEEYIPVLEGLCSAARGSWSGLVRVLSGEEQIGTVVLREGKIAWAVCKYQREDLGTFLLRRGHVSAEQLREVRARYESLGKTRKLASLLEEAGIADRQTLRNCLMLHIRRALACMLSLPSRIESVVDGELKVEEGMTFKLEELIPGFEEDEDPALTLGESAYRESSVDIDVHSNILAPFAEIPGYRGAVIAAVDGRLFAGHGFDNSISARVSKIGVPAAWLRSAAQSAQDGGMGMVTSAVIECEQGTLLARWIYHDEGIFLAVFLDTNARVGIAKHRVAATAGELELFVAATLTQDKVTQ